MNFSQAKVQATTYDGDKVTIYFRGEDSLMGNVHKVEARLWAHGTKEYAQYQAAPFIIYTPKGKRNKRGFTATSHPYILVVKGWGQWPAPPDPFTSPVSEGGVTVTKSRYLSHDDRYVQDFEAVLGTVDAVDIIADYRGANANARKYA
jgi:hypothetical protein